MPNGRAKQKARKTASPPFVFNCEINVQELSNRLGKNLVMRSKGFLAIRRRVPPTVILNSSELIVRWVSQILQGESYQNISPHHPGINRLARWVEKPHESWHGQCPSVQRNCHSGYSNGCPIFFEEPRLYQKIYVSTMLLNSLKLKQNL